MTAELAITGSGEVGHVASWAVSEDATPHSLGGSSSVGSLSVQAVAHSSGRSVLLNDSLVSLTEEGGSWSGRILSAPVAGQSVSVTAESALRFLNSIRTAPPIGSWIAPDTAIGGYGTGNGQFIYPGDVVFDSNGNMFVGDRGNGRVQKFTPDGSGGWVYSAQVGSVATIEANGAPGVGWMAIDASDNLWVTTGGDTTFKKYSNALSLVGTYGSAGTGDGQFTQAATGIAIDGSGNIWVGDFGGSRVQKFNSSGTYVSKFSTAGRTYGIAFGPSGDLYVTQAQVPDTHNVARYTTAGSIVSSSPSSSDVFGGTENGHFGLGSPYDLAFLGNGTLLAVDKRNNRVQSFTEDLEYIGKVGSYGSDIGNFSDPRGVGVDVDERIYVADSGNHRIQVFTSASLDNTVPLSEAIETYIRLCDPDSVHAYSYDAADDPDVNFPGWTASVWTMLCQLCAMFNLEIYYTNGTVHVDDIGGRELDITQRTQPTFTPSSVMPACSVEVINQNIQAGDGLVMYDAAIDNTIHTVDVGTFRQVTIATTNHPIRIDQPTPTDSTPLPAGHYTVQDADGLAVPYSKWLLAGGSVNAAVGDGTGLIDITIRGPRFIIAGYTGPFSLAYTLNGIQYAGLSITGSGVTTDPVVVTVGTGADPDTITQEVGQTFESPFVTDTGKALDAGVWAACDYLFGMELSFDLPRSSTLGFGDYVGRKFTWNNARWRVMSATISKAKVSITARWHTTVGELDDVWDGQDVDDFDTAWAGSVARDVTVTPIATGSL